MSGKRKFVWNGDTFVDVTNWKPAPRRTPYIVRDSMAPAVHPATGRVMDSKSAFREQTRAHGLVEVGNDYQTNQTKAPPSRAERKRDVAQAIQMLEQGHIPPPVESVSDWGETRMIDGA